MKTGPAKKKKVALQWKEDKGFSVAVRMQPAGVTRLAESSSNVLVLSENETSFTRILSVAAAA
jgi:hypothetical protein